LLEVCELAQQVSYVRFSYANSVADHVALVNTVRLGIVVVVVVSTVEAKAKVAILLLYSADLYVAHVKFYYSFLVSLVAKSSMFRLLCFYPSLVSFNVSYLRVLPLLIVLSKAL